MPVTTLLPTLYRHILIRTAPAQAGLSQWVQECDAALPLTTPWRAGSRHKVASKKSNRRSNSCPSSNQRGCCRNQACSKPRRQSVSAQKKGLHDSSHLLSFWSSAVLTVAAWTCHTKTAENLQNTHVDGSALVPLQLQEVIAAQQAQAKNQALLSNSDHWGQWGASLQTHRGVRCGAMISFYF